MLEHPEGVTPKEVGQALGMSNDDAGKYLRRALEHGRIDSPKRGIYTPGPKCPSVRITPAVRTFGRFGHLPRGRRMSGYEWLDALMGSRSSGGCPDCDAEQSFSRDNDGIYHLLIEHDPTCPRLARIEREA